MLYYAVIRFFKDPDHKYPEIIYITTDKQDAIEQANDYMEKQLTESKYVVYELKECHTV